VTFPNEPAGYREARQELLEAEIALRDKVESVAALRRALPVGGKVREDYSFDSPSGPQRLSELFVRGDSLVAYGFMYGPKMDHACPMCTSMLDALDGQMPHLEQRTNVVVIAKSPIERILEHARARGWSRLKLLSSAGTSYNRDYHAEAADGSQLPMLNVFVRRDGDNHHAYATEMLFAKSAPGQDNRHIDMIWPLWNLLDFTPEGRGSDWRPKLAY
jgi:predicted dithiol-disulfide oxidoreductase (DUF899 family)